MKRSSPQRHLLCRYRHSVGGYQRRFWGTLVVCATRSSTRYALDRLLLAEGEVICVLLKEFSAVCSGHRRRGSSLKIAPDCRSISRPRPPEGSTRPIRDGSARGNLMHSSEPSRVLVTGGAGFLGSFLC